MDITSRMASEYEERFKEHGDSYLSLGWTSPESTLTRYKVMLDVVELPDLNKVSLLDWGCGLGHFYEYIQAFPLRRWVSYCGMDASSVFIRECQRKHRFVPFYELNDELPICDYVIMNGLFTEKFDMPWQSFWDHAQTVILDGWAHTKMALAVNFMSTHLEYERGDLFHLPLDTLGDFLHNRLSREFRIRHDYKLWEYTVYVYR